MTNYIRKELFYDESIKRNDYSKQDDECNKIDNSIRRKLKIIGK